jgi:hypothetical protein
MKYVMRRDEYVFWWCVWGGIFLENVIDDFDFWSKVFRYWRQYLLLFCVYIYNSELGSLISCSFCTAVHV